MDTQGVNVVAWSSFGQKIASGSNDYLVKIWDAENIYTSEYLFIISIQ